MTTPAKERRGGDFDVVRHNEKTIFRRRKNILNLRPKFRARHPWVWVVVFLAAVAALLLGLRQISTRADVYDFYPTTCLGNWQNVSNAEGVPETLNASSSSFASENSAIYTASSTQIYCGGFIPPSFATSGQITNVGLTLVWQIGDASTTATTSTPTSLGDTSTTDAVASSTDGATSTDIVSSSISLSTSTTTPTSTPALTTIATTTTDDASTTDSATSTDITSVSTPTSTLVTTTTPITTTTAATTTQPAPAPATDTTSDDASGTSFIRTLIPFAFADEVDATTTTATATSSAVTSTASSTPIVPPAPDDNFLDVSYSTDGQTWISVGQVNINNWQNFTVTLPITDWTDLQNLQVRVEGISTTQNPVPPVYLDGMFMEVHYNDAVSLPITPPTPPPDDQSQVSIPAPPPRIILVSPGAQQSCDVQPFSQALPLGGTASFMVNLYPSIAGVSYNLTLGDLPAGISADFGTPSGEIAATSSLTFQAETSVVPGSINVQVVYQEHEENGSTLSNFCQLNLDIK